ncbi:hypothetical protein KM043_013840 [Ampulex compressa]|nr:hypothetical protein KM043_013840 [Ampulex compressa]
MPQTQCDPANGIIFHAVYIPEEDEGLSKENGKDNVRIYQDKIEALKVIKEFKTGRLKTFKTWAEAEEYARSGYEKLNSCVNAYPINSAPAEEKSSNFKGPRPQELVCFRKLIESGDIESVKATVWANPRYLISIGDTPAILQEGCRYNALHIAVKADKANMCELILNTVGNPEFIKLLYGEKEAKNYLDRAQIMLDLYLNTPDKGLNETPLHFAVKFGQKDVVRVLVSYSHCIKTLRNKYKQLPIDIICTRKRQENERLKKEIQMLLEDQYYVPVLRSEDNTLQPMIGEPFSPTSPPRFNTDPISPRIEVRAFAGPMSKTQAVEFRRKWKTPPRTRITPIKFINDDCSIINNCSANIALRLQDTEKGLERVGRDLAEEYHVPWKEYWPFLNDFSDFRCAEGLTKLEKYLEQRFKIRLFHCSKNTSAEVPEEKSEPESINEIEYLCKKLQSCTLDTVYDETDYIDESEFFTPPSSPTVIDSDDDMQSADEGCVAFIEGPVPTKLDDAVYNAVPSSVSCTAYPNIYRWRHDVQLAMKRDSRRLDTARMTRRKLLMNP